VLDYQLESVLDVFKQRIRKMNSRQLHGCTTIPVMKVHDPEMFYEMFCMTPEAFDMGTCLSDSRSREHKDNCSTVMRMESRSHNNVAGNG